MPSDDLQHCGQDRSWRTRAFRMFYDQGFATELAWDVIDKAMQAFGAMGMTKELPLHLMASHVRLMRIYEGPSEVHRMLIARHAMQGKQIEL